MQSIRIDNCYDFFNIDGKFYGGFQNWLYTEELKTKFWADRSCGVVAAANTAYYLTLHHGIPLYSYSELSVSNFTLFVSDIYSFIKPLVFGVPNLKYMKIGFLNYAKTKGVCNLSARTFKIYKNKEEVVNFLKDALENNYPVMMLNWNSDIKNLKYHWVTITGYFKDINTEYITISNWGRIEKIEIDKLISDKSIYKGLIYFKL